jgi:glycosyltransferase involved in cell wall biosynthesis
VTKLSIIVPVLNETVLISELLKRIAFNVEKITSNYEIIIVDDGSQDDSWNEIVKAASDNSNIRGINFSKNFGHHYAITAGLNNADGDWIVVMDGDLQDRPEVIPDLYNKALEGFDIVYVSRQKRTESFAYLFLQRIFYLILNLISGLKFDYKQANFSIMNKKVLKSFNEIGENSRFYVSTLKWLGFKEGSISAQHGKRFAGKPSYTLRKRLKLALEIIISQSERPLRIAFFAGIIELIGSLIVALTLAVFAYQNKMENIFELAVLFVVIFCSATLKMIIGILGIYIGKNFIEVKKRPLYIINQRIN